MTTLYKICGRAEWGAAVAAGVFRGAPVDLADGFVHFSTAAQVAETAARHFAGRTDLVLVVLDAESFGARLRWEPSRGGALFPHLYATFDPKTVRRVVDLPLGSDGLHVFPELEP